MKSNSDRLKDKLAGKIFSRLEKQSKDSQSSDVPRLDLSQSSSEPPSDDGKADQPFQQRIETDSGPIWISQNAIMCACPECMAPVSIRTWLLQADCWDCEISIELSEQQRKAVEELLQQQENPAPQQANSPELPVPQAPLPPPPRYEDNYSPEQMVQLLRRWLGALPAWLISFLVHVILILILALILIPQTEFYETITLSTFVTDDDQEGGVPEFRSDLDPLQFDSLIPSAMELDEEEWREEIKRADEDAEELIPEVDPTPPEDLERVKENLTQRTGPAQTFLIRDPRLRNEILKKQGGTSFTEAAVARGLRWLAQVQNSDGSWSLSNYAKHSNPRNKGDAAGTSLALLPFLGAGQTHELGRYRDTVHKGIKWLLDRQKQNGDLRCGFQGDAGMYVHGQATIVLVEALSMTGDEHLREACERAVRFIEDSQHRDGGWRYHPGQAGDTSVFGWQIMALQSAKNSGAGISVDRATLKLAGHFLDNVSRKYRRSSDGFHKFQSGALYRYMPEQREPTLSMTAEALLCRMYLGWPRDDPRIMQGVAWLLERKPGYEIEGNRSDRMDLYYWYYGTQVMHHYGGKEWDEWNERTRDLLYILQEKKGTNAGSWKPTHFKWGRAGGRIYTTSLAVCTLEVYYRHLPLFDRIEFE